ncbi:hypothetical protein BOCO_0403 [Bombiscardovia coagulans]|uniref:Uncharacterized protein n=1 Tax=Bombiscardovia coagulans TaxID=686666 RepID=A0A261ET97_9BIFI|nr:hypothetical protein BOCO_0403 [Bombiscardovia coagulans]
MDQGGGLLKSWLDEYTLSIARELRKPATRKQYLQRLRNLDPEYKEQKDNAEKTITRIFS